MDNEKADNARASGKSNLQLAIKFFQNIISESFNNVKSGEETAIARYYIPFLFEEKEENSEFQIIEMLEEYEYKYGFEYNAQSIVAEWLYRKSRKTNREVIIFERTTHTVVFGSTVRKECDLYKEQIPKEILVLSFFNRLKLKTPIFKTVYNSIITGALVTSSGVWESKSLLEEFLPDFIKIRKEKLVSFLKAIDTGTMDISFIEEEKQVYFLTEHIGKDGRRYPLNLYDESEGTIKSIIVFMFAQLTISKGNYMFIDELNIKLHPRWFINIGRAHV